MPNFTLSTLIRVERPSAPRELATAKGLTVSTEGEPLVSIEERNDAARAVST